MNKAKPQAKIIIEGITYKGEKFRPADWAERMCDSLSTFRGCRVIYSPFLQPALHRGNKCVILDPALAETHPALYEYILSFAKDNNLQMHDEGTDPKPTN
jgi:hypothetical protein